MLGIAILAVALFAAALTGMFTRVKNQKTTTGVVVSLEHKCDSGEKSRLSMLMWNMRLTESFTR